MHSGRVQSLALSELFVNRVQQVRLVLPERDGAVAGYLLTLYPMENLVKESKKYGTYRNNLYGKDFPKIQVVSVEEMLQGSKFDLPTVLGVLKSATKKGKAGKQEGLRFEK